MGARVGGRLGGGGGGGVPGRGNGAPVVKDRKKSIEKNTLNIFECSQIVGLTNVPDFSGIFQFFQYLFNILFLEYS